MVFSIRNHILLTVVGLLALGTATAEFKINPIHAGVFNTLGLIDANGDTTASYGSSGEPIENQPYTRFGAWVSVSGTIEERTSFSLAMGLMTWNSQPLTTGSPFTRMQSLGSGLGHAFISHKYGNVEAPCITLKLGAFPYSYSSSKNLGGHLLTGGTYPGHLSSNWWQLIDGNHYNAQGLLAQFALLENSLKIDVGAFFEHWLAPNYDISPTIIASYNLLGLAEIGVGAVFSHLITWDKEIITPRTRSNAYYNDKILPPNEWSKPGLELTDTLIVAETDPRYGTNIGDADSRPDLASRGLTAKYYSAAENGVPTSQLEYYTFKGTKAMGRLAITPFRIGQDLANTTIYAEATLLGVKDYPFFFEKKSDRLPVLFGISLPLPGGFEVTLEAEYYKNKFMNHIYKTYVDLVPQWWELEHHFFVDSLDLNGNKVYDMQGNPVSTSTPTTSHKNGEWMWNISANKTFYDRITFRVKMARDYLRLYNFFGNPSDEPAFQNPGGWYLAIKSEVSI